MADLKLVAYPPPRANLTVMATTDIWNMAANAMERFDDVARTVSTLDEQGEVVDVRPYTAAENADADAKAAQPALDAEHAATKGRVQTIITDLKAEKDRLDIVINKTNAQIGPGDTKDVARAAKRIADAAIDLAKYVDGA